MSGKLRTETNTTEVAGEIQDAFAGRGHVRYLVDFEHGQWWVSCQNCGGQWSVVDAEPGGFDFEEVTAPEEGWDA